MDETKEIERLRLEADRCLNVGDGTGYNERMQQISELTKIKGEDKCNHKKQ
ncbi:MAG: hypothetical protein ABSG75_14550 [Syntrophales bacterium]|jgi:hypothetical protein